MNVLGAEVSKRLTECAHFVQIPDDERNGGFEMTLEECQVVGKQRTQIGRYGKKLVVETRSQLAWCRRHLGVAALDQSDCFRCHNPRS